jgi:hypothetical protein
MEMVGRGWVEAVQGCAAVTRVVQEESCLEPTPTVGQGRLRATHPLPPQNKQPVPPATASRHPSAPFPQPAAAGPLTCHSQPPPLGPLSTASRPWAPLTCRSPFPGLCVPAGCPWSRHCRAQHARTARQQRTPAPRRRWRGMRGSAAAPLGPGTRACPPEGVLVVVGWGGVGLGRGRWGVGALQGARATQQPAVLGNQRLRILRSRPGAGPSG